MEDKVQSIDESAKSQDFFQDNKAIKTKYTTTIKSRNFLTNIAYVGINKEDYYNKKFIFDVHLLLTKNLNLFSLDRKLTDKTKHKMIYMLWRECMPTEYYLRRKELYLLEWKKCTPAKSAPNIKIQNICFIVSTTT